MAVATAASGLLLASSAMAADQKIAVVNVQEVMGKIPQRAAVLQALEAEFKDDKAALLKLEKDIKYFQEKKKRDATLMSKKEIDELDTQIATLFQEYQTKGKALQQKSGVRQNEEMNKLIALVKQAIDGIAAKGKYDIVLEQNAALFSKPEHSITTQVVEQVSKLN